jgi:hypothetical protein
MTVNPDARWLRPFSWPAHNADRCAESVLSEYGYTWTDEMERAKAAQEIAHHS